MKKHQGRVSAQSMVAFLLFEPAFPRSLRYCLKAAADQLGRIWTEPTHTSRARLASLIAWLESQKSEFDIGQIHPVLTYVVDESAAICVQDLRGDPGPPAAAARQRPARRAARARASPRRTA